MALLEVKNIYKSFGGVKAIQDFSLAADAGQIHGIIGPNGAGKTTIFNVISGVYPADQGSVTLNVQDYPPGDGPDIPEYPLVQGPDRRGKRDVRL